jgi:uncharacterized membrane protein (DUF485 family)
MPGPDKLEAFARKRRRTSLGLSAVMLFVYFGFILLGAFSKDFMGSLLMPGLSWGILLGATVIVVAFALTGLYVRSANRHELELGEIEDREQP